MILLHSEAKEVRIYPRMVRNHLFDGHILTMTELEKSYQKLEYSAYIFQVENIQLRVCDNLVIMCAWCKRVHDIQATWHTINLDLLLQANLGFTHSICKTCLKNNFAEYVTEPN